MAFHAGHRNPTHGRPLLQQTPNVVCWNVVFDDITADDRGVTSLQLNRYSILEDVYIFHVSRVDAEAALAQMLNPALATTAIRIFVDDDIGRSSGRRETPQAKKDNARCGRHLRAPKIVPVPIVPIMPEPIPPIIPGLMSCSPIIPDPTPLQPGHMLPARSRRAEAKRAREGRTASSYSWWRPRRSAYESFREPITCIMQSPRMLIPIKLAARSTMGRSARAAR